MVQIEAYPPPKFSWYMNGRPVLPSQRFKINYENNLITLVIFNVQPEDSGDYVLKASNDMGECTWKTTLNVRREYPCGHVSFEIEAVTRIRLTRVHVGSTRLCRCMAKGACDASTQ